MSDRADDFDRGVVNRRAVLGDAWVDKSLGGATEFNADFQSLITRYAWRFGYSHAPMRRLPVTSGLVGAAVREWRLVNVPDVRKDQRYLPMNPETRSELIVPLFYKGRIIGVLDLEHTRTGFFNEEHERILTTLATGWGMSTRAASSGDEALGWLRADERLAIVPTAACF